MEKTRIPLLPNTRGMWLLAIFFIMATFIIYYTMLYPQLSEYPIESSEIRSPSGDPLIYTVQIPRFVADYVDQELIVTVSNPTGEAASVPRITVRPLSPKSGMSITLKGNEMLQDFVELGEIPPFSTRRAVFLVHVDSGAAGKFLNLGFFFGAQEIPQQTLRTPLGPKFNRLGTFKSHILVQTLLVPPLSNVVLPLLTLAICWFLEPYTQNWGIGRILLYVLALHVLIAFVVFLFLCISNPILSVAAVIVVIAAAVGGALWAQRYWHAQQKQSATTASGP